MFYDNSLSNLKLKTMDTTTVMEIIKMIDVRLNAQIEEHKEMTDDDEDKYFYASSGIINGMEMIRDHLQSFIEAELNKAEQ